MFNDLIVIFGKMGNRKGNNISDNVASVFSKSNEIIDIVTSKNIPEQNSNICAIGKWKKDKLRFGEDRKIFCASSLWSYEDLEKGFLEKIYPDLDFNHKYEFEALYSLVSRYGGIAPTVANILKKYGSDSFSLLQQDPYRILLNDGRCDFKIADRIALALGIIPIKTIRARYALKTAMKTFDCPPTQSELFRAAADLVSVPAFLFEEALKEEIEAGEIVRHQGLLFPKQTSAVFDVFKQLRTFQYLLNYSFVGDEYQRLIGEISPDRFSQSDRDTLPHSVVLMTGGFIGKVVAFSRVADLFDNLEGRMMVIGHSSEGTGALTKGTSIPGVTLSEANKEILSGLDLVVLTEADQFSVDEWKAVLRNVPDGCQLLILCHEGSNGSMCDTIRSSGLFACVRLRQDNSAAHPGLKKVDMPSRHRDIIEQERGVAQWA